MIEKEKIGFLFDIAVFNVSFDKIEFLGAKTLARCILIQLGSDGDRPRHRFMSQSVSVHILAPP